MGSTFGFAVPLGSARAPTGSRQSPDEPHRPPEVVVIEDDRPSLDLLTAYLEAPASTSCVARDGAEGLERSGG